VVEAVAARIASDQVPSPLKGQRLIAISTGALIAGGGMVGEVESRIEVLLQEARECDAILFFDEVHTLMGAGGREGTGDVASLIKPALSRGDIRCIAATTDDEYHRYIKNDAALDRRFLPIRLRELSPQESRHVLALLRDAEGALEPHVSDVVLDAMIERMQRVLPNRHFPDKAIDLFDQVIAHARVRGLTEVTVATVDAVAERMAGIPASPALRLERLSDLLRRGNWCREEDIEALTERLSVTLRGLDLNMERPNLVADVIAPSLERVRSFAREMARTLYGDPHRVIELDGSTFGTGASLTGLVGASAGYVGYGDRHLLAPLAEQPCHVLLISGMEQADPAVRELLVQAIDSGWITDQRNRRIPFSEAIVLQWVAPAAARSTVGFTSSEAMVAGPSSSSGWRVDLSISLATGDPVALALEMISRRWAETEGITIRWDPSVSAWASGVANVAQFLDQELTRSLWRLLGGQPERRGSPVLVAVRNGQVVLVPD
jgi:ATP-dependent Clp protease ATP-binding subunit ClpC